MALAYTVQIYKWLAGGVNNPVDTVYGMNSFSDVLKEAKARFPFNVTYHAIKESLDDLGFKFPRANKSRISTLEARVRELEEKLRNLTHLT